MTAVLAGVAQHMLTIRPVEADDVERLRDLFFRLSPHTVYLRFFSPVKKPSEKVLAHLAAVDHWSRDALAAVVDGEIVAVARYDRDADDPERAEFAVVVEDEWQGHGLGSLLLDELAQTAHERGVTTLTATVLGENQRMLSLARRLGPVHTFLDHGEWGLEIPLEAPVLTQVA
jgi:RimJ/RimL family protein N-acetyltransferase